MTAVFDVPASHPVRSLLEANAIDAEGDVILRRVQSADGRSRVFINDQPTSVTLMREVGRALVELHGQHDERALIDAGAHRAILDAFGSHAGPLSACRTAWALWREAEQELARQTARVEAAVRESDFLRGAVEELERLDPQPGEESILAERRAEMMRAEKIASDVRDAEDLLSGSAAPSPQLASLLRRLQRKQAEAPGMLDEIVQSIDQALVALDAAQLGVSAALRAIAFEPEQLEKAEERLFALRAVARKHNTQVDDLAALRDAMAADLADLDAGGERLAQLKRKAEEARATYDEAAAHLSQLRRGAAVALKAAVMTELPALKLERAEFLVELSSEGDNRQEDGVDIVEFWVRTNPGTRPGPMMKVASGGELSRFLLALKVALADKGSAPTLVFDEIDTGVGGAVADAIGQRLARLAARVQVLSVTHAPQVAARAHAHFLISKSGTERVATEIRLMDENARQEEIARMLAGATITDEARAAAASLLRDGP